MWEYVTGCLVISSSCWAIAQKLFINYANIEYVFGVGIYRPNS
ncbi:MAG: hypothetical protein SWX82_15830 [Cyanobacteriota bacterium]|nr:hypothetical protein [Cyanobacteriota bacterium]